MDEYSNLTTFRNETFNDLYGDRSQKSPGIMISLPRKVVGETYSHLPDTLHMQTTIQFVWICSIQTVAPYTYQKHTRKCMYVCITESQRCTIASESVYPDRLSYPARERQNTVRGYICSVQAAGNRSWKSRKKYQGCVWPIGLRVSNEN